MKPPSLLIWILFLVAFITGCSISAASQYEPMGQRSRQALVRVAWARYDVVTLVSLDSDPEKLYAAKSLQNIFKHHSNPHDLFELAGVISDTQVAGVAAEKTNQALSRIGNLYQGSLIDVHSRRTTFGNSIAQKEPGSLSYRTLLILLSGVLCLLIFSSRK